MPLLNVGTYSDAHPIIKNLWQGSAPPPDDTLRRLGFDRVVLCAQEYQPPSESFGGIRVQHCPLDDALHLSYEEKACAKECGESIARGLARGEVILVTCMAGRNRSGLVTAIAIREFLGMAGDQAGALVKAKRPNALTNPYFVRLLEALGPKPVGHPRMPVIRRGPPHPGLGRLAR